MERDEEISWNGNANPRDVGNCPLNSVKREEQFRTARMRIERTGEK